MARRKNGKAKGKKKQFNKRYQKKVFQQVETKKRQDYNVAVNQRVQNVGTGVITASPNYPDTIKPSTINNANYYYLPIDSFNRQCQKISRDGLVGQTLFSRNIYLKGVLDRQTLANATDNIEFEVIHGWVTAPAAWSNYTAVQPNTGTKDNLNEYILDQIREFYEERDNTLIFTDKKRNNFKVVGVKKYKLLPTEAMMTGNAVVPLQHFKCHWHVGRKVQYTKTGHLPISTASPGSEQSVDSSLEETNTFLNLNSWLPWAIVRFPNRAGNNSTPAGTISWNSIHYYSDE